MLYPKPRKRPKPHYPVATINGETVPMGRLRDFVIKRDGPCILALLVETHRCAGYPSLEHVIGVHGHHDGRHHDNAHCVALCSVTNVDHTSHDERELIRAHLRIMHPVCEYPSRGGDG